MLHSLYQYFDFRYTGRWTEFQFCIGYTKHERGPLPPYLIKLDKQQNHKIIAFTQRPEVTGKPSKLDSNEEEASQRTVRHMD